MLPRLLCEQLCSLNPDVDRLTFSVVWKITEEGEILDQWFGRSVIRSVAKLSYDHAQSFIENPDQEFSPDQLPPISSSTTIDTVHKSVLHLFKVTITIFHSICCLHLRTTKCHSLNAFEWV